MGDNKEDFKMILRAGDSDEYFSTDQRLNYNNEEWFKDAFDESDSEPETYIKRSDFETSNWLSFQKAARIQREIVLDAIASAGIVIKQNPAKAALAKIGLLLANVFDIKDKKSFSAKAIRRAAFRFGVYGAFMIFGEVAFYSIVKLGRSAPFDIIRSLFTFEWLVDPRLNLASVWDTPIKALYGQASLWMFFVYASIGLFGIEPLYSRLKNKNWIIRGFFYMSIILFMECLTGWILKFATGYDIWYYNDRFNIFKYTSAAIAPMWFIVGLISENFARLVQKYSETKIKLREFIVTE
uniref:Uncharacterized protein n=1 Tax=uncultured microorganism TaxID=358574 RepID=F8UGX9_9ZZZZ|nr:hypothetical protein LDC_03690 [uncultured microorganism]